MLVPRLAKNYWALEPVLSKLEGGFARYMIAAVKCGAFMKYRWNQLWDWI